MFSIFYFKYQMQNPEFVDIIKAVQLSDNIESKKQKKQRKSKQKTTIK